MEMEFHHMRSVVMNSARRTLTFHLDVRLEHFHEYDPANPGHVLVAEFATGKGFRQVEQHMKAKLGREQFVGAVATAMRGLLPPEVAPQRSPSPSERCRGHKSEVRPST